MGGGSGMVSEWGAWEIEWVDWWVSGVSECGEWVGGFVRGWLGE